MKTYYIYTLTDPRNNKIFYVGCTTDIKRRLSEHISNSVVKVTDIKKDYFEEMKSIGIKPSINIIDEITTANQRYAYRIERAWIRIMQWRLGTLINTSFTDDIHNEQEALDMINHAKWLNQKAIENVNKEIKLSY